MAGDLPLWTPEKWKDLQDSVATNSIKKDGWARYSDTVYTSGAPYSLTAATEANLSNAGGTKIETYKEAGVSYYDTTSFKIAGRLGDKTDISVAFKVVPTDGTATYIEVYLAGGGEEVARQIFTFPKGAGVERRVSFSTTRNMSQAWETSGYRIKIISNGPCTVYDADLFIYRKKMA